MRETIQQVPRSEELKIKELVLSYDLQLDSDDSLSREGRIGKNLSLAILYLELERHGDALWALDAAAQILVQPIVGDKEDFLQHPKLTVADIADTLIRLRRRLFLTSRRTVFSSSPPRDARED